MIPIKAFLTGIVGVSLCMANISGVVTDTGSAPIAGAVVQLEKGGQTATTGADGSFTLATTAILPAKGKLLPKGLSAGITGNLMRVTIAERAAVEVATFNLNGKSLSTVRKTLDAGTSTMLCDPIRAGIYLYKVKSGNRELLLKGNSIGGVSSGSALSTQGFSSNSLAKQAKVSAAINDVIAVTKAGYLNYRVVVYNSDTSNIQIKMIVCAGTVTDTDGNVYQTVKIGTQVWMVENLKTTKYNDGAAIPLVTDSAIWNNLTTPGYCWYNNNATYMNPYGALYNWFAVNTGKLAPTGWHVATDAEWSTLVNYLGDSSVAGGPLKEAGTTHWILTDSSVTNSSGFSALPGGLRSYSGTGSRFGNVRIVGFWWSSTVGFDPGAAVGEVNSWGRDMFYQGFQDPNVGRDVHDARYGFSVRGIKN